ncbi:MAG TPA: FecR domain-containing protein [Chitinophaga sp.]|uniref:FecR family protein n=1 Tax=Chitinophaga sp. TaxID=1869181 RepID=UPI002DBAD613|nr:FecR domain-containing protein [Chitinophaga sp.]HEU4553742.1 FecR domain-containing protein [Chitinophaga sp.]
MDTEHIKQILERYTQGQCTAEESAIIEKWFDGVNRHSTPVADDDLDLELEAVKQSIHENIQAPRRRLRTLYYMAAAACLLLLAGTWLFTYLKSAPTTVPDGAALTQNQPGKSSRTVKNGFMELRTAKGATERVVLADGSTIVVNAGSHIRYPVQFAADRRDVYLEEGEAFFTVAPNDKSRFTVHTGNLQTTALGTSFNIRDYAHENRITVALLSGKVKIDRMQDGKPADNAVILMPNEQVHYDMKSLQLVKSSFEKPEEITGWKQGYLVFKDASYNEVITEIENRYGVTVINHSNKTEWKYTGFFKEESLQDVVETICLAKSLSYTISNDTIVLKN